MNDPITQKVKLAAVLFEVLSRSRSWDPGMLARHAFVILQNGANQPSIRHIEYAKIFLEKHFISSQDVYKKASIPMAKKALEAFDAVIAEAVR